MKSLPPLDLDAVELFDAVVAEKHEPRKAVLLAARPQVLSGYRDYSRRAPHVEALDDLHLTADQCEALVHSYTGETAPLFKARSKLLERVEAYRCPFCGLSEAATLDHYLPKELHPQFAIYPKNLIPCCYLCNNRKREKVVDEGTQVRLFLHPYYDTIPALSFVSVDVQLAPDALLLRWSVNRARGMRHRTFLQLQSHFHELDLASRYRRMSLDLLRDMLPALQRSYGGARRWKRVSKELGTQSQDAADRNGSNYWKAVLFDALAHSREFCDEGFLVLAAAQ